MDKKTLWLRLKTYEFDHLVPPNLWQRVVEAFGGADAATKAFADKLARKLGWSTPFALRAVAEYRKFVYLGMVSDFPVTPSKVIDQVWHEHLLFSRGYREFCDQVLGREFDHHPELVPVDEQTARFQAQYDATLELYQTEFDRVPPAEFWGTPKCTAARGATKVKPRRSSDDQSAALLAIGSSAPLHAQFDSTGGAGSHGAMPEFGPGDSGGGGGEWGGQGDGHAGADSTSGHGGDSGGSSDGGSGGGDGGGSGCSSGCGGCGSS